MLKVVHDEAEPNEASSSVLDVIVREAARQMHAVSLSAAVARAISGIRVSRNRRQGLQPSSDKTHRFLPA